MSIGGERSTVRAGRVTCVEADCASGTSKSEENGEVVSLRGSRRELGPFPDFEGCGPGLSGSKNQAMEPRWGTPCCIPFPLARQACHPPGGMPGCNLQPCPHNW